MSCLNDNLGARGSRPAILRRWLTTHSGFVSRTLMHPRKDQCAHISTIFTEIISCLVSQINLEKENTNSAIPAQQAKSRSLRADCCPEDPVNLCSKAWIRNVQKKLCSPWARERSRSRQSLRWRQRWRWTGNLGRVWIILLFSPVSPNLCFRYFCVRKVFVPEKAWWQSDPQIWVSPPAVTWNRPLQWTNGSSNVCLFGDNDSPRSDSARYYLKPTLWMW